MLFVDELLPVSRAFAASANLVLSQTVLHRTSRLSARLGNVANAMMRPVKQRQFILITIFYILTKARNTVSAQQVTILLIQIEQIHGLYTYEKPLCYRNCRALRLRRWQFESYSEGYCAGSQVYMTLRGGVISVDVHRPTKRCHHG